VSWLPDRWAVVAYNVETTEIKAVVSRHFWRMSALAFCQEMERVITKAHMFDMRGPWMDVAYRVVRLPGK